MNLGASIREIRKEKGYKQGAFAKKVGMSQTSMYKIENGIRKPTQKNLDKICKALDIPEAILHLNGLTENDIPEHKKEVYRLMFPVLKEMIKKLIDPRSV